MEVQEVPTRCLASLGLAFSSALMIVTWVFSCREPLAALGHQGWVRSNAYLKSGWERLVRCSVGKLPTPTVWLRAHCPSLLRSITRSQPQCGLKSDVYRPFRDHAAYPVSELFIQGLRTQTFSGMQALQPCVVQSQAVCERCERL